MAGPLISQLVEDDEEKAAREHIEEISKKLREAQKVDLAFLLDATGSMGPSIKGVKNKIVEIAEGVKGAFPKDGCMRFACAFYRDYDADEDLRYQRSGICCGFTDDVREFQKQLEGLEAWGGLDDPEDVFSGLERLLDLEWTAPATRLVYHIADAPCHGRRFHDPEYAKVYPDKASTLERFRSRGATSEDDPEGRKIEEILGRLAEDAKISTYTFLHIHSEKGGRPKTAKMLEEFKKANNNHKLSSMGMVERIVEMLGRGPTAMNALAELLLEMVGHGVKCDVNSRMNDIVNMPSLIKCSSTTTLPMMCVDATTPIDWSTLHIQEVWLHRSTKYDTLGEMLTRIEQGAPLGFRVNAKKPILVRVAKHPFTHVCATRWPYYAQIQVDSWKPFVIKRFKYVDKAYLEDYVDPCKNPYLEVMETYAIAAKFASQFYEEIKKEKALDHAKQVYLDAPLSTCKVAGSEDCFTIETLHSSKAQWIKVDEKSEYYKTIQAFSHWTHVYSDLLMVIVHTLILVEGETPEKAPLALLCDPTIHSREYPRRFKRTNKGEMGIQFFYDNHKCNDLCKVLRLQATE